MIKIGHKVKISVVDGRKSLYKLNGIVAYKTDYIIGVDTGLFVESFNVADIIAPETSSIKIRFINEQGKYVRGYIRNYPWKLGNIELEKCIQ